VNFIRKAFHALKQTFVPENVRSAFKLLGLEFNITQTPSHCCFERTSCVEVEGSTRLRKLNILWTNSPKEVEKRDMDGSINMNRADKSPFSVTLAARPENICS
jgi:hypothetical protein